MELNASNLSNTIDRSLITYYSEQGTVSKGTLPGDWRTPRLNLPHPVRAR